MEDWCQLQVTVIQDPLLLGTNYPKTVMPMKMSPKKIACALTFFFLIFLKIDEHQREESTEHESEGGAKERKKEFFSFLYCHPLALAVIKSFAVFIFIHSLDDL